MDPFVGEEALSGTLEEQSPMLMIKDVLGTLGPEVETAKTPTF